LELPFVWLVAYGRSPIEPQRRGWLKTFCAILQAGNKLAKGFQPLRLCASAVQLLPASGNPDINRVRPRLATC